jgi:hypothetical protein
MRNSIISFCLTAAIFNAAPSEAKEKAVPPLCSAKIVDLWQHRSFAPFADTLSKLPESPCLMPTDTGDYSCQRNVGCSRYFNNED